MAGLQLMHRLYLQQLLYKPLWISVAPFPINVLLPITNTQHTVSCEYFTKNPYCDFTLTHTMRQPCCTVYFAVCGSVRLVWNHLQVRANLLITNLNIHTLDTLPIMPVLI